MSRIVSLILIMVGFLVYSFSFAKTEIKKPFPKHTSKITAPMNIVVDLEGPAPQKSGDTFELVGTVRSSKNLKGIKLTWQLGDIAELIQGDLSQSVDIEAGKPYQTKIQLKALQVGYQQVRLTAQNGDKEAMRTAFGRVKKSGTQSGKKKKIFE